MATAKTNGTTQQQKLFAFNYFHNGGNATKAAIDAGYSKKVASQTASRLLTYVKVKEIIDRLNEKLADKAIITKEKIAAELAKSGFTDIRRAYDEHGCLKSIKDLPDDIAGAITGIKVTEIFEGSGKDKVKTGETVEVRFNNKTASLAELSKLYGYNAPTKVANTDNEGNALTPALTESQVDKILEEINKQK